MNTKPQGWCTLGWCWSSLALQSLSPSSGWYQPPCAPAPRELCRPLCSSLQSRIAMLSCCTGWHPRRYWQHRGAEGSGGLCASVNHSYHASSPLQELLLWEKKHLFPCEIKQSFFSMSKNSVSGLSKTLQRVSSQNCGYVGWCLGKKETFFVILWHSVDTFFNLNQLKILYETVDFNIILVQRSIQIFFCYRKSLLHDTCFFKNWAFVMIMTNIISFLLFKGVEVTDKPEFSVA